MQYISKKKPQLGREDLAPMLEKKAICEVNLLNWEACFLSSISLVLKKGKGKGPVINWRELNGHIMYGYFKGPNSKKVTSIQNSEDV
jgi:hypothetical protein